MKYVDEDPSRYAHLFKECKPPWHFFTKFSQEDVGFFLEAAAFMSIPIKADPPETDGYCKVYYDHHINYSFDALWALYFARKEGK